MKVRLFGPIGLTVVTLAVVIAVGFHGASAGPPAARARLAVLVVFDQLRGDYLQRWNNEFGAGGFRRLLEGGAWFENCHYPYSVTVTGAGHASLLTGCSANHHGIIGNNWYDRATGKRVYCATAERYDIVPAPPAHSTTERGAGAPDRLLVPTLGDALKDATAGKARVVSLSFKDRSAVLPAGRKPDACYWANGDSATFVTSTFYRDRPHDWVVAFNQSGFVDRWFGQTWDRLRPDLDYERLSGPDDVAAEGTGTKQGRVFPHPLSKGLTKPGKDYYKALYTSPFGNEVLLELVKRAVVAEKLGTRDLPDLLCLSFSCNDPVGHAWGPDSQEVLDITLRADLIVKELLTFLDTNVGQDRYVIAMSADHGVAPIPEVAKAQGKDAGRVAPEALRQRAEKFLQARFGAGAAKEKYLEDFYDPWCYLDHKYLRGRGLKAEEVEQALADWLKQQPEIQTAYTRTQLTRGVPAEDLVGRRVAHSFHPQRSGDVVLVVKPYYQVTQYLTGTGHGTPHSYDTHVPLVVFGTRVKPGRRSDAVTPQAAAAVLAHALGVKPPAAAEAPLPRGLFVQP